MANPSSHTHASGSSPLLSHEERGAVALDAAGTITTSDPRALLHLAFGCGDEHPIVGLFDTLAAHLGVFRRNATSTEDDVVLAHLETLAKIGSRLARISEKGGR